MVLAQVAPVAPQSDTVLIALAVIGLVGTLGSAIIAAFVLWATNRIEAKVAPIEATVSKILPAVAATHGLVDGQMTELRRVLAEERATAVKGARTEGMAAGVAANVAAHAATSAPEYPTAAPWRRPDAGRP